MSKLSQLCSYLGRADATELCFAVGAPATVKSTSRDLPVTVSPLTARNIAKFFEGTAVSGLLAGGNKDETVALTLDGSTYQCRVVKEGTKVSVAVTTGRAAPAPAPARVVSARSKQAGLERDFNRNGASGAPGPTPHRRAPNAIDLPPQPDVSDPRPEAQLAPTARRSSSVPLDLPPLPDPEPLAPRGSSAPHSPEPARTENSAAPRAASPAVELRPEPARASSPPAPESAASPAAPVASLPAPSDGLGAKLAPTRASVAGTPRIESMLRTMVEMGASDLHLSSDSEPIIRLHGKMQPLPGERRKRADELASLLLEIMDDDSYRDFVENADADFAYSIKGVARFRANYFADRKGMGAVFRQIPVDILQPDVIGLPPKVLDLCWLSKGLVLVTGPTGSGKSTTLASMVDFINRNRDDHIITIEDPIEFVHENKRCLVNQREVGRHTRTFKSALRAALREDPDVVLVGELRDLETIAIAVETAETGHLVFGTLHTTTAPSTIDRLIDQFPGDQQAQIRTMLGESLRGVIGQTLLRRKSGGRVAAYEVLLHTSAVGNLIREGKTHQLRNTMQVSKDIGMQNLNDNLLRLVADGTVDAREAYIKAVDKQNLLKMYAAANIPFDPGDDAT